MAIIGNHTEVLKFFSRAEDYKLISDYFLNAIKDQSQINKRLFDLPMGSFERFELDKGYYALEQKFMSKEREKCFFESHIKHIDIQFMISGEELMECVHISKLKLKEDLSQEKDFLIYEDYINTHHFLLKKGDIAVFFPQDAHMGGQRYKVNSECLKTVIKMPLQFYHY